METEKLLFEKESYELRGIWFDIFNAIGPGHKEVTYVNAFVAALEERGLEFSREPDLPVFFRGKRVGTYRPDFIVRNKIIVEFKSSVFIAREHIQQVDRYLRGSPYALAFLVNFGSKHLEIVRRIDTEKNPLAIRVISSNPRNPQSAESVQNPRNPRTPRGVTVVELVLVVAVVTVLAILGLPFVTSFQVDRNFDIAAQEVLYTLRRAQGRAMAGERATSTGVHFISGTGTTYTFFVGSSFAGRSQVYDEEYSLPGTVTLTKVIAGGDDVVYKRLSGKTDNTGTITLTSYTGAAAAIGINTQGRTQIE